MSTDGYVVLAIFVTIIVVVLLFIWLVRSLVQGAVDTATPDRWDHQRLPWWNFWSEDPLVKYNREHRGDNRDSFQRRRDYS